MKQELAISPLAIISLYLGGIRQEKEGSRPEQCVQNAITQHEGTEPYINGSVMLKGKGLEHSPLYF